MYPCFITDVYLLTTLYVLEVTEGIKEVKELMETFREDIKQHIDSKFADPKVPAHGELYSFCFCFCFSLDELNKQPKEANTQIVRTALMI